jgi:uncharacterized protein
MILAAVDTNVLVRGAISSHPNSASKRAVDAFFAGDFLLLLSPEALIEIHRVLADDKAVRTKHSLSDEEIADFCHALQVKGRLIKPQTEVPPSLTRDLTDTKWVALVLDGKADYLVTLDRKHLRRLKRIDKTKVVSPRAFLEALNEERA